MKNMKYPLWTKILAFCISTIGTLGVIGTMFVAIYCMNNGIYHKDTYEATYNLFRDMSYEDIVEISSMVLNDKMPYNYFDSDETNVAYVEILDNRGKTVYQYYNETIPEGSYYEINYPVYYNRYSKVVYYGDEIYDGISNYSAMQANVLIAESLNRFDKYKIWGIVTSLARDYRYKIYKYGAFSVLLCIIGYAYLFSTIGHKRKDDEPQNNWETSIPFDLTTVVYFLFAGSVASLIAGADFIYKGMLEFYLTAILTVALVVIAEIYLMSIVVRCKTKTLIKNTIIYKVLAFIGNTIANAYKNLKLSGRVAAIVSVLAVAELIIYAACHNHTQLYVAIFILEKLAVAVLALQYILPLGEIRNAGKALASGDLSYKLDASKLKGAVKEHAIDLNSIGDGLGLAVDSRLRSERMKTELITNVSHDIKTPLTSIINYTDLIQKEETNNEKVTEYTAVLQRQAEKLKRLIEDLVEASKASTGNLDVELVPCDANVFVDQAEGEYAEKLSRSNLTLITKHPETPVRIMADGRRMWRIFDNLLNNICKYSVPGTRAYLSLEVADNCAVFSFKNTSTEELDMTPDELLERFVRGDKARNTEGNGLGLSIVKSLTDLQDGTIDIMTDGDLFKVILTFPLISE